MLHLNRSSALERRKAIIEEKMIGHKKKKLASSVALMIKVIFNFSIHCRVNALTPHTNNPGTISVTSAYSGFTLKLTEGICTFKKYLQKH